MAKNVVKSPVTWLYFAGVIVTSLCKADAFAAEVCRFVGTTDYAGHVTVTTDVAATGDATRIDVALTFESTTMFWFGVHYLVEEVSTWRAGQLESVAVNSRYLVGEHIVRQQWDEFQRSADSLQAYRVQAKTLADFRRRHPGFVQHWDPATFSQPWLDDYQSASPERRADLDFKGSSLPPGLRSPLAMAFYWINGYRTAVKTCRCSCPALRASSLCICRSWLSLRRPAPCGERRCVTRG
jgi:hypothetical protein